jgi:NEDD4-binding protein 2
MGKVYIMRGLPGCGKTTRAKELVEKGVILSTDDFFMIGEQYHFDPLLILDAHQWNQKRFRGALELGISPIVVDNTNILHVHMDPYIDLAQQYGYDIEVVPISTNMSDEQLAIRNVHGVPLNVIRRMRELYQP